MLHGGRDPRQLEQGACGLDLPERQDEQRVKPGGGPAVELRQGPVERGIGEEVLDQVTKKPDGGDVRTVQVVKKEDRRAPGRQLQHRQSNGLEEPQARVIPMKRRAGVDPLGYAGQERERALCGWGHATEIGHRLGGLSEQLDHGAEGPAIRLAAATLEHDLLSSPKLDAEHLHEPRLAYPCRPGELGAPSSTRLDGQPMQPPQMLKLGVAPEERGVALGRLGRQHGRARDRGDSAASRYCNHRDSAMLWLVVLSAFFWLLAPPLVAWVESVRAGQTTADVGFWTVARSLAGTCHVPWGRRASPIIRFALRSGEGRIRATRTPGRSAWVVEVRGHQRLPFGFAARICSPPAPPARFRAPGLTPVVLDADEPHHLAYCSLESTDERLLRWVLRHAETRLLLDDLQGHAHADHVEVLLAGTVVILRATAPHGTDGGRAVELIAPGLVDTLRRLSDDLDDLATALVEAGEPMSLSFLCRGCGARVADDPWHCPSCNAAMHRGCREMAGGCVGLACAAAPDALPEAPT